MSRTIGAILTVAAVAVAIAVPVFGLAAATAAIISAGISAAMMVNALLMPKGDMDVGDRQASATTLQLGEGPRGMAFGEVAVAGTLVDVFNYGGDYGTDWEVQVRDLADHKCHSLPGLFVNDTFVAFAGDGAVSGYNGQLEVYFRDGSWDQAVPSILTSHGPGWTANDRGRGVAYVVVAYKADAPDQDEPVWPGGRPQFLPVLKGKLCYQARKDSTVAGGSGSHRWDDPATWEWTDNPIDCRFNWSRGVYAGDLVGQPEMLLVGRGLTEVEQPPANVAAPANLCDELVGGEKQFRVDGLVYSNERFLDVEERFAAAVGGVIVEREGAVEIEPAQAKAPSFAFTDADLLSGSEKQWNEDKLSEADDEWVNTVIPRYVEPDQRWKDHAAPVRRETADIIADGGPRERTVGLPFVKRAVQAGIVGEIHRRLGRLWGRGSVALGPRFAEVEAGDWGTWTSDGHFGGATKTFRVEGNVNDEKWQSRLQLREIASSVYSPVTALPGTGGTFNPTPAPTLVAPALADWVLTATVVAGPSGPIAALLLTGAVSMSSAELVKFEYRVFDAGNGDNDNWVMSAGLDDPLGGWTRTIAGLAADEDYEVSVRYRVSRQWTPRRILGPVTTAESAYETSLIRDSGSPDMRFALNSSGELTISDFSRTYSDIAPVSIDGTPGTAADGTGGTPISTGAVGNQYVLAYYDDHARAGGAVTFGTLVLDAGDSTSDGYASAAHPGRHTVLLAKVPTSGSVGGGSSPGTGGGGIGGGGYTQDAL